jgi:lipid A 3-O-deacylase
MTSTMNRRPLRALSAFLICAAGSALAQAAPARTDLVLEAGRFDFGHGDPTTLYGIELRGQLGAAHRVSRSVATWRPEVGGLFTSESARYGYAGLRLDLDFPGGWRLSPGFDIGAYSRGDDKDLGHTIEFRSSLELARAFGRRQQLGVTVYHMSNASLSDVNPGANSAALVYAVRLGRLP